MNILKNHKKRKGFSLIELIVVILIIAILALAVFAGGSAAIKKSQIARTTSDLHNFSIAVESALNETPSVANMKANTFSGAAGDMKAIVDAVNNNLSADYQLGDAAVTANINDNLKVATGTSHVILKSDKTDAWGNNYFVIFDYGERHDAGQSDFYVTVVSAGPNAQTTVGGKIESDDLFLLAQYSDGDVAAVTYNCGNGVASLNVSDSTNSYAAKSASGLSLVTKGTGGSMLYAGGADNTKYDAGLLPVNF